jgi:hypothetical protein
VPWGRECNSRRRDGKRGVRAPDEREAGTCAPVALTVEATVPCCSIMLRDGYIERAIQKLAAAVARAAGLREAGNAKEALEELRDAKANLPVVPGVLDVLSPRDLRRALGSDDVVMQLVDTLRQEALGYLSLGLEREAVRAQHRAERLAAELGSD